MGQQFLNRIRYYLDALQRFIRSEHPLMLVIGPQGSGKRPLLEAFSQEISDEVRLLSLESHAELTPQDLIDFICEQWQLEHDSAGSSQRQQLDYLLRQVRDRQQSIILCNNAQKLSISTLAALMHLASQQEDPPVNIHLILAGEAELEDKISSLTVQTPPRLLMQPLSKKETFHYINYRLSKLDSNHSVSLGPEVLEEIYLQSGGFPNLINHTIQKWLCEKILDANDEPFEKSLFAEEKPAFPTAMSNKQDDLPIKNLKKRPNREVKSFWQQHTIKTTALSCLALAAIGLWLLHKQPVTDKPQAVALNLPKSAPTSNQKNPQPITMQSLAAITHQKVPEQTVTNSASPVTIESLAAITNKQSAPAAKLQAPAPSKTSGAAANIPTPPKPSGVSTALATPLITKAKSINLPVAKINAVTTAAAHGPKKPYFTIQFIASNELTRVERFRQMYKLINHSDIIWLRKNGATWYALISGKYTTQAEAESAMKKLPSALRTTHPWVKQIH